MPNAKLRRGWLLLCSYFFYMCWDAKYILLILFVTIVTYISGILISNYKRVAVNDVESKKS